MKWKYFGFGIIISCVLAFAFRHVINKPDKKISNEKKIVSNEEKTTVQTETVFVPLSYASITKGIKEHFKGKIVNTAEGLLLTGSQKEIDDFISILEHVDKPPQEYLIDVLLLSVDKTNTEKSGLVLFLDTLADSNNQIIFEYDSMGKIIVTTGIAQILKYVGSSDSRVKIESHSQISVLDGEPANIKSGERRAVITDSQTDGVSVRSSYQYVDIGLSLSIEILPGSCEEFAVLRINQNADNVTGYTYISGDEIPVIAQRSLKTSVRVDMGETVVLGGLTQEHFVKRVSGIPGLRSLPFFGKLFSNISNDTIKSELIIVLQPIIPRLSRQDFTKKEYIRFKKVKENF